MKLRHFSIRDLLWLTALTAVLVAWWMEHRKYARFMELHDRYLKWRQEIQSGQSARYETELETMGDWQGFCFALQDDVKSLEWSNKELKKPHRADGRYQWIGTEQQPMMLDTAAGILWRHSEGSWHEHTAKPPGS